MTTLPTICGIISTISSIDCQADNVRQQNGESAALFSSAEEVLHRCFNNWVKAVGNHHTARERRKDAQNAVHTVQEGLRVERVHSRECALFHVRKMKKTLKMNRSD